MKLKDLYTLIKPDTKVILKGTERLNTNLTEPDFSFVFHKFNKELLNCEKEIAAVDISNNSLEITLIGQIAKVLYNKIVLV